MNLLFALLFSSPALAVPALPPQVALLQGEGAAVTVSGLTPGAEVVLVGSPRMPTGARTCSRVLPRVCTDLAAPARMVGRATANASGSAVMVVPGPALLSVVWLQPLSFDGARVQVGAVAEVPVLDPAADPDGDTLLNREEVLLGTWWNRIDSDADMVDDDAELGLGTDPLRWDSDNDTLSDGQEAYFIGTNPAYWDTDGDGVSDMVEYYGYGGYPGSNPLLADTDGGGTNDYDEGYVMFTDPNDPADDIDPLSMDYDMDGLIGYDELLLGTDPNDYDTDDDLVIDGDEVWFGTDPLDPLS